MPSTIPSSAIVFLGCITAILLVMILFLLYIKQVACCKKMPTPFCFGESPKPAYMDDSDEELFDKFEDLMSGCQEKEDKPVTVDEIKAVIVPKSEMAKDEVDDANITDVCKTDADPSLQLGIQYHPSRGILNVQIMKGQYLQISNNRHDCYIKLLICTDNGYQLSHADSKIVEKELHPTFDENFQFNIPQFQIKSITLMVSVYNKMSLLHKEMIGWIGLGSYNSSNEQLSHWNEVMNNYGNEIIRRHMLLKPEFLKTIY